MKLLVKTSGDFNLMDGSLNLTIGKRRPHVVPNTGFVGHRISVGQLIVLHNLPNEATDEEFEKFWLESDKDTDLAVASYISTFEPKEEAPKTTRGRRGA